MEEAEIVLWLLWLLLHLPMDWVLLLMADGEMNEVFVQIRDVDESFVLPA